MAIFNDAVLLIDGVARQGYLAKMLGETNWNYDLALGVLSFDGQKRWDTQAVGTESQSSNTWLWAWANTASSIPDHLLIASLALKTYGEQHGIPELIEPELPLDQIDGHTLALLASGLCDANAYYHCPYDGGALFVLIMDENFPEDPTPPLQRLATVFPQAIASLDIPDHRLALIGYLDHHGLVYEQDSDTIIVRENGEPALTATFDEQNRLTKLEASLNPQVPAPNESWDEFQLRADARRVNEGSFGREPIRFPSPGRGRGRRNERARGGLGLALTTKK